MDSDLYAFALRATVTLFVVVDPVGVAPMFAALTRLMPPPERRAILLRAVIIAYAVTLFFLLAGHYLLAHLGVTVPAFAISGGILLFATALPMLFGRRAALQAPEGDEAGNTSEDIAVFPLAIPLLSGPGTITTVLLLGNQARAGWDRMLALMIVLSAVFLVSWVLLRLGEHLMRLLGAGKIHILTRVLGIVLAAVAVQYVLDGALAFYQSLR